MGDGGGGHWVSPDGMAPSRMVDVSASVNLPLHHKVQKFSSGAGSPGWSRKKGRKTVVVWWCHGLHVQHICMAQYDTAQCPSLLTYASIVLKESN